MKENRLNQEFRIKFTYGRNDRKDRVTIFLNGMQIIIVFI